MSKNREELEFADLFSAIWQGKYYIAAFTLFVTILSIIISLQLANIYKAQVLVIPSAGDSGGGLNSMAAQLGGLASLTGINLNSESISAKNLSLATLKSRQFLIDFVHKYNLSVPLIATKSWNQEQNKLVIDPDIYDELTGTWLVERRPETQGIPSDWELYKAIIKILEIEEDKKSGVVAISISHYSPFLAKNWVDSLVSELNNWMRTEKVKELEKNIAFMEQKIGTTTIAEMQKIFYQLIEEQTKTLMLASVNNEYAFKVVDPAVVPEEKDQPKRSIIVALSFMLSFLLSTLLTLFFKLRKKTE
ncbi:LPS O-antigen length regulator [Vibrio vulnificus]|nr:LPS O-antigen length regulator [Vibrio vulnificus]